MSHILIHCRATPVRTVWKLAKQLWPHDETQWPDLNIGTILGCTCLEAKEEGITVRNNRECTTDDIQGTTRLLQILISEAAHLIWVLRCERAIQEKTHNEGEIEGRWVKAINWRLTDEKITATRIKRGKKFTRLVEATWEEALKKSSDLPQGWINNCEVLVGSRVRHT